MSNLCFNQKSTIESFSKPPSLNNVISVAYKVQLPNWRTTSLYTSGDVDFTGCLSSIDMLATSICVRIPVCSSGSYVNKRSVLLHVMLQLGSWWETRWCIRDTSSIGWRPHTVASLSTNRLLHSWICHSGISDNHFNTQSTLLDRHSSTWLRRMMSPDGEIAQHSEESTTCATVMTLSCTWCQKLLCNTLHVYGWPYTGYNLMMPPSHNDNRFTLVSLTHDLYKVIGIIFSIHGNLKAQTKVYQYAGWRYKLLCALYCLHWQCFKSRKKRWESAKTMARTSKMYLFLYQSITQLFVDKGAEDYIEHLLENNHASSTVSITYFGFSYIIVHVRLRRSVRMQWRD